MNKTKVLPILLLATPSLVLANNLQDEWAEGDEKSAWSGYVSADYSRNGFEDSAYLASRVASATGVLRYAVTEKSRLQLVVSGYHQQDGDVYGTRGQFLNDTSLSWARNGLFNPTEGSSVSGEIRAIFPTSDTSEREDLQFGTRVKLRWSAAFDEVLDGLTLSNTLLLRKNFHEYKTAGGHQLIEYRLSNQVSMDYAFADDFYLNIFFMPRQSWNYLGNSLDPTLLHGEEIGYQMTESISMSVGMTNSVNYYNPDKGQNPLNDLIDLKKMTYYAVVNYQF